MRTILITILMLFTLVSFSKGNFIERKDKSNREVLVSFCQATLPENLKQENVTFTDIYSFKINEEGKPVETNNSRAKYTRSEEIEFCMKNWKLIGFSKESVFHVEFSWVHGVGWTQMRISSKDFSQTTYIGDKSCSNSK